MEKKKLKKLSLNKETICDLSIDEQKNILGKGGGGGEGEGTTSFNNHCTGGPICCPNWTISIPKSCCKNCGGDDGDLSNYQSCMHICNDTWTQQNNCNMTAGGGGARAGGDCTGGCGAQ